MRYEFSLAGKPISKKNNPRPTQRKDGKLGIFYDQKTKAELNTIAMQIPPEVRDLNLLHPMIDLTFHVPPEYFTGAANRRFDKDGALTALLDIFVVMGVISDDGVSHCNGTIILREALPSENWFTEVVLE